MSLDTALALVAFAFVMSASPGPGNFLLLASGANFGFTRSLPLILGISFGFLAMVFAVSMGFGQVLKAHPGAAMALRFACGVYVLWLAARIARSRSLGAGGAGHIDRPFTFFQAASLQLLNPKAWAVALTASVTYLSADATVSSLLLLIAIFALVNLPTIGLWAVSGHWLRASLATGRRLAVFNIVMASLLVASMVPMLLPLAH